METFVAFRRVAIILVTVAFVAGCAEPPSENRPVDLNRDGDGDGIPDGNSPVEGANEPEDPANATNDTWGPIIAPTGPTPASPTMPGILPPTPS